MRLPGLLLAALALLTMPAALFAGGWKTPSYNRGKLSHVGSCCNSGCATTWISDCGKCSGCGTCGGCKAGCPGLLPALIGGVERFLVNIFYCPSCGDSSGCKVADKAPCGCEPFPLFSFGRNRGCAELCRSCDSGGGKSILTPDSPWTPATPSNPFLDDPDPEVPPPAEVRLYRLWDMPVAQRALSKRSLRENEFKSPPVPRSAPRVLSVAATQRIKSNPSYIVSDQDNRSVIKTTSAASPDQAVPTNPLR